MEYKIHSDRCITRVTRHGLSKTFRGLELDIFLILHSLALDLFHLLCTA
jgi:hypothetical protein